MKLELEIKSSHPWYSAVYSALYDAHVKAEWPPLCPNILASVTIGGVEEFYRLDSIHEVVTFQVGQSMFHTTWHRVATRP